MSLQEWLTLFSICALGAASPGPSLALVMSITLDKGRNRGLLTAIGHGVGIAVYAMLALFGLAIFIEQWPQLLTAIHLGGGLFLLYLGLQALRSALSESQETSFAVEHTPHSASLTEATYSAALRGFAIAILNPKIALFFVALFGPFTASATQVWERGLIVLLAGGTDGLWYCLVVAGVSRPGFIKAYRQSKKPIDACYGLLLLSAAIYVLTQLI